MMAGADNLAAALRFDATLSKIAKAGGTAKENCDVGNSPTTGNCHHDMTQGDFATSFAKALQPILTAVTGGIR